MEKENTREWHLRLVCACACRLRAWWFVLLTVLLVELAAQTD